KFWDIFDVKANKKIGFIRDGNKLWDENKQRHLSVGSNIEINYKCSVADDHKDSSLICSIISSLKKRGKFCAFCGGRKLCFSNSLAGVYPECAERWDYLRNKDTPNDVFANARANRWFLCNDCGKSLKKAIFKASKQLNCKKC